MKKICLCIALAFCALQVQAQLTNPDFEELDTDGRPVKWKAALALAIPIDSSCTGSGMGMDSLHVITEDAYTGKYALEMRNGFYCGNVYAGNVRPGKDNSDTFTYGEIVPFTDRPATVSFYYRLHGIGGDKARFDMHLSAGDGTPVADAYHTISTNATQWTFAEIPLVYTDEQSPASITMLFQIGNDTALHYGSRFLIDHIRFSGQSTGVQNVQANKDLLEMKLYPVPATEELNVRFAANRKGRQAALTICDATGRQIQKTMITVNGNNSLRLPVHALASGLYVLQVRIDGHWANATFIK